MGKHGQKSGRCLQVQISWPLRDWLAEGCLVMQWGAAAPCVASPAQDLRLSETVHSLRRPQRTPGYKTISRVEEKDWLSQLMII